MAGFRTHITVSTGCGIVYGGLAADPLDFRPATAVLAAGVTAVGGMLPDLDSDSGVPVRLAFGLVAALSPLLLLPRFHAAGFSHDGTLAGMAALYLIIRYPLAAVFKRLTVHRGMWHSIPAMLIAGLVVYLEYGGPVRTKLLLAGGVMVGFLSHLLLDELYSVDFNGVRVKLNAYAGTAVKFVSPSVTATCVCYGILGGLGFLAYQDWVGRGLPNPIPVLVGG
jgi:membrane-bound metal-dependent hydrolase YbcI (DUF457 family)